VLAVVFLLLWIAGMITATTVYGFLHLLLILAIGFFLIGVIERTGF
jgi:hypothetical protein